MRTARPISTEPINQRCTVCQTGLRMKKTLFVLSALVLLTACNQESKEAPKPAPASVQATLVPATPPTDKWVGKWLGVEGLNLTIAKDDSIGRGHYILTMQYGLDADDEGTFKGEANEADTAKVLGWDVAGVVKAVGSEVSQVDYVSRSAHN